MTAPRVPITAQVQTVAPGRTRVLSTRGTDLGVEHHADRQVNAAQRRMRESTLAARTNPYANGLTVLLGVVFAANVAQVLQHGLGRAFQGYEVKNVSGGFARFQRNANPTTAVDSKQITLTADANCTADVWVY